MNRSQAIAGMMGFLALLTWGRGAEKASAQDDHSQPVRLRYKFTKGETLKFRVKNSTTMTMNGQTQEMKVEMPMRYVVDGAGQDFRLRAIIDRVQLTAGGARWDSSNAQDAKQAEDVPMLKLFLSLVDSPIKIRMKETGEVLSCEFKELKKKLEDAGHADLVAQMQEQVDSLTDGGFIMYPDRAIPVGHTWKGKMKAQASGVGTMKEEITLKLDGFETVNGDRCARVTWVGKLTLEKDPDSNVEAKVIRGEERGTLLFSIAKGRPVKIDGDTDVAVEVNGNRVEMKMKCSWKSE